MEYGCHVRSAAPSCYLDMLEKRHNRVCRAANPLLERLAYRGNVAIA